MLGTFIKKIGRTILGTIRAIYIEECTTEELDLLDSLNFSLDFFCQFSKKDKDIDNGQRRNIDRIASATAFHTEILKNKAFTITSPFSKNKLTSQKSRAPFITTFHSLLYDFEDNSEFILILSDYWFEATAVYLPKQKLLISKRRNHINLEELLLHDYLLKLKPVAASKQGRKSKHSIVLYHNHLAHHLLNELSSIQSLLENGLIEQVGTIYYHNLPMGNLEDIFPELPAAQFHRISHCKLIQAKFQNTSLIAPYQKSNFHPKLVKRLLAVSVKHDSKAIENAAGKYYPIIWVSVRTGNRVWQNQAEGLGKLSKALKKSYADPLILIDGYSTPFEIDPKNKVTAATIRAEIEREKIAFEKMIKDNPLSCQVISLIGKQIQETIHWTQIADFYLTHCGTLHHKIAWMTDIPGIVHCNEHYSNLPEELTPGFTEKDYLYPPLKLSKAYITDTVSVRTNREGKILPAKFSNYTIDNHRLVSTTMRQIAELKT